VSVAQSDQFHITSFRLQKKPTPLQGILSQNQKYKKVLEMGQKIAGVASQVGMPNFREVFAVLEQLLSHWENVSVVVTPKEDGSSLEHKTTHGDNESLPFSSRMYQWRIKKFRKGGSATGTRNAPEKFGLSCLHLVTLTHSWQP